MKTFNFMDFITNKILILLFLSAAIVSISGCAYAPLYSNASIPNNSSKVKYKIAIKKQNIKFSYSLLTGTPLSKKEVEIYKCLGIEIHKIINNAGTLFVNKKPEKPNIIYIHDYRKAYTWAVVNPVGILMPISALFISEPFNARFEADALINGKEYDIMAKGSSSQKLVSPNPKKILRKVCGNFVFKLKKIITTKDNKDRVYAKQINKNKPSYIPNKIIFYSSKNNRLSSIYADNDPNFKKFALYVYKTSSPYIYSNEKYIYNAIPVTFTLSGCRIISVIRKINGNSKHNQRNIENYKICRGNIFETESSNISDWDTLPENIKPIINEVYNETREYGKANANHKGYTIIGKADVKGKSVNLYVLKGILLEAIIKK